MSTPKQIPGCLPRGYTLDSLLTPEQFCVWRQVGDRWFRSRRGRIAGLVGESKKTRRVHPRTYLERALQK